jgi:hypothetical protein
MWTGGNSSLSQGALIPLEALLLSKGRECHTATPIFRSKSGRKSHHDERSNKAERQTPWHLVVALFTIPDIAIIAIVGFDHTTFPQILDLIVQMASLEVFLEQGHPSSL